MFAIIHSSVSRRLKYIIPYVSCIYRGKNSNENMKPFCHVIYDDAYFCQELPSSVDAVLQKGRFMIWMMMFHHIFQDKLMVRCERRYVKKSQKQPLCNSLYNWVERFLFNIVLYKYFSEVKSSCKNQRYRKFKVNWIIVTYVQGQFTNRIISQLVSGIIYLVHFHLYWKIWVI